MGGPARGSRAASSAEVEAEAEAGVEDDASGS